MVNFVKRSTKSGGGNTASPTAKTTRWLTMFLVVSLCVFLMVFASAQGRCTFPTMSVLQFAGQQQAVEGKEQIDKGSRQISYPYEPARVETYVLEHRVELGYENNPASGCNIWKNSSIPIYNELRQLLDEMDLYQSHVQNFTRVSDVRVRLRQGDYSVCDSLELHPHGHFGIFQSKQLSKTQTGLVEPILPPGRHPRWCLPPNPSNRNNRRYMLNLGYLVHDFAAMCRTFKPTTRTVLVDIGASLEFGFHKDVTPAIYLTETYSKFGIPFEHIYAYEITPIEPKNVFEKVPDDLMAAYHWINVGVETDPKSKLNPWRLVREHFDQDDFIVVKLDVDKNPIELELIRQMLEDDELLSLVDQFYFEHHISLTEFWPYAETIKKSLELFNLMRTKGITAHYWV